MRPIWDHIKMCTVVFHWAYTHSLTLTPALAHYFYIPCCRFLALFQSLHTHQPKCFALSHYHFHRIASHHTHPIRLSVRAGIIPCKEYFVLRAAIHSISTTSTSSRGSDGNGGDGGGNNNSHGQSWCLICLYSSRRFYITARKCYMYFFTK